MYKNVANQNSMDLIAPNCGFNDRCLQHTTLFYCNI